MVQIHKRIHHLKPKRLKRELGLFEATLYGIGVILGAGIYALIGVGAGIAGNALWIAFAIAALIAGFTALSYAELSSMFPRAAAEYVYTKKAFGRPALSFVISWLMVITTIVAASTVALGFGGYLAAMLGFGTPIGFAAGLIVILSLVNWWGIKFSARFNVVASSAETFGLILVVLAGAWLAFGGNIAIDLFEMPAGTGLGGIMVASALVFFAYIGFEEVANIAEETKKPTKTVPRALLIALLISTALYILVSLSAVTAIGWEALSASPAPLAAAVQGVWGPAGGQLLSLLALFATANTVLITMITASRILYGMGRQRSIPTICARIGRRGTPYISVFLIGLLALATLALGGIKTIALLTDLGIFIVYLFVNLSLIWLRYTQPRARRPFKAPLNVGRFPLLAALGVAGSGLMLLYFEPMLLLLEAGIIAAGAGIYVAIKRRI